MTNIISTQLSDKIKQAKDITRTKICATLQKNIFPGILINSEEYVKIENGLLSLESDSILLFGKTLIEIVKFLNDNNVDAWLTSSFLAGYPAILIQDFRSHTPIKISPDSSPLRLSEIHSISSNNLVVFSEDYISRDVLNVWENNKISTTYQRLNDLLFFDNINSVSCLINYKISKYFLFCGKENIVNTSKVIGYDYGNVGRTTELDDLLIKINSENKDVL